MLDSDQTGGIDKAEQEEAMKKIHSIALPKARWTWSAMDTDGDGKISVSEFHEGMQAISNKVGEEQLLDCIIRAWTDHPLALEFKGQKGTDESYQALLEDRNKIRDEYDEYKKMLQRKFFEM